MNVKFDELYGSLRDYQREGVDWLLSRKRAILADAPGLGKTVQTLCCTASYDDDDAAFLIVGTTFALWTWKTQIKQWLDEEAIISFGTKKKRQKAQAQFCEGDVKFLIITYGQINEIMTFSKEARIVWDVCIADEFHKTGLLNYKSAMYENFSKFVNYMDRLYMVSGTITPKGIINLFAPLHLMDKPRFKTYWGFIEKWCIKYKLPFGTEIDRYPKNKAEWSEMLKDYVLSRKLADVGLQLPPETRVPVVLDLSAKQLEVYTDLEENLYYINGFDTEDAPGGTVAIINSSTMVNLLRLRQLLVCPKLLGIDDWGSGLEYIAEEAEELWNDNRPIVVFTHFAAAIPLMGEFFETKCGAEVYSLRGGMSPSDFGATWQGFQSSSNVRRVLICSISSGASFEAFASSDTFFLGPSYIFDDIRQAEMRVARFGQTRPVMHRFIIHNETVEEAVMAIVNSKMNASGVIMNDAEILEKIKRKREASKCSKKK